MKPTTTNIPSLDPSTFTDPSIWAACCPTVEEWAAELAEPFDDVPTFGETDSEVSVTAGLSADLSYKRTPARRLFRDYRANPDAYKHLEDLPTKDGEDLEMVISGRYAMWDLVPALVEKTGQNIALLTIATLSYSTSNAAELLGMLDGEQIGAVDFLVSYYFKSTSRKIYDTLVPQLLERDQRVLALRTHAKIILARMEDGTCYAIRGSPNLRSSKNIEQLTLTRCPDLYAFHKGWIEDELLGKGY